MNTTIRKIIAVLLVILTITATVPVSSYAASVKYIEVTKDNAVIRTSASEKGKVIVRCKKNAVLTSTGTKINSKLNKWYKVKYNGKTAYIYSGNVKSHSHSYRQYNYAGVTYKVCKYCGNIIVTKSTKIKKASAGTMASYAATAGALAAADGPIPVGDIVATAFLALGAYYTFSGKVATGSVAKGIVTEIDFEEYLKKEKNSCSDISFRRVKRTGGTLKYRDRTCLNMIEAYICARYLRQDVHTKYYPTALALAELHVASCNQEKIHGSYYTEKDQNQPSYFYHFHLKISGKKINSHIFYSTDGFGRYPS